MGFKAAKQGILMALAEGRYLHAARKDIDAKNDLKTGRVTADQVAEVIKRSRGFDHSESPHHQVPSILVHTITKNGWYIKFYFLEPDAWFISVHQ